MNRLASVIIDIIFTYCSTKEMLLVIERVCVNFMSSSRNNRNKICWNNIDLSYHCRSYNTRQIFYLLHPRISRHSIISFTLKELSSCDSISLFTNLHTLSLKCDFHKLKDPSQQIIFNELSLLKSLSKLKIHINKGIQIWEPAFAGKGQNDLYINLQFQVYVN